jgi:hypothetical protein
MTNTVATMRGVRSYRAANGAGQKWLLEPIHESHVYIVKGGKVQKTALFPHFVASARLR